MGDMNGGPDDSDNDQPCTQWYCARCDTIAWTYGSYEPSVKPPIPSAESHLTSEWAFDTYRCCDEQVVINIMEC